MTRDRHSRETGSARYSMTTTGNATYRLRLGRTNQTNDSGRPLVGYTFGRKGEEPLFAGDDLCPSPFQCWDDLGTVASLMNFLTTKPGDTDPEYFEGHTAEQLAWVQTADAEEISLWVYDRQD